MFFKQIRRNAKRNRKANGLFFGSLIIAIVAFYTLLSLGEQDVMRFLKTMESDAVRKLMLLIPVVYVVSLFFVFFLVYFAYRYQLDNRKKEFGLYLMLGMKRSKLFALLMGETIWNSFASLLLGLPIALFLTEGISFATAKLVGLGIIEHRLSFSLSAIFWTIAGFMMVQIVAMVFLSIRLSHKEPIELLQSDSAAKQQPLSMKKGWFCFVCGIVFLIMAYVIGVTQLRSFALVAVVSILVLGFSGTFLLYRGMGVFIGYQIQRNSPDRAGLFTFTGRQIQENVLYQHRELAIASLLLLIAMACISFGIGVSLGRGAESSRTADFSIQGSEQDIREILDSESSRQLISAYYPMLLGHMNTDFYDETGELQERAQDSHEISWDGLKSAIMEQSETESREYLLQELTYAKNYPHLISESSYNALLQSVGKQLIDLGDTKVAFYSMSSGAPERANILDAAMKSGAYVEVDGQRFDLLSEVYTNNVVSDRKITLLSALIVPDTYYREWVDSDDLEPFCWNVRLSQEVVDEKGLMQSIQLMEGNLAGSGLEYESFLSGLGRNLFYAVSASYLTIYLGILFIVIANTVIGLKYLMQQRANERRYLTLLMLGASVEDLCKSANKQIRWFFSLVLAVAVCSSVFAIWSMFMSFLKLPAGTSFASVALFSGVAFVLVVVIEFSYIRTVEKISSREIRALRVTDRG